MQTEIEKVIRLFHKDKPLEYEIKTIRDEDKDSRWVIFLTYDKEKYVLKIAANSFTTEERVNGWHHIIDAYSELGYYCPAMKKSIQNQYVERCNYHEKDCLVWEEEYSKYCPRTTLEREVYAQPNQKYVYHDEVLEFIARVGQQHYDFFTYPSGFVRLEPFASDEICDEITECVAKFESIVYKKIPNFITQWERIKQQFVLNTDKLKKLYNKLPTSVFQADTFQDNLILDENGHFKGVLDFNLSGKEVCINIFFVSILYGYSYQRRLVNNPDVLSEMNDITQDSILEIVMDSFSYMKKFYKFSKIEEEAAPLLLKYMSCIEYRQLDVLEKNIGDEGKLHQLFDFMERQVTREDIDFQKVML